MRASFLLIPVVLGLSLAAAGCEGCFSREKSMEQAQQVTSKTNRAGISTELKLIRGQIELYRRLNAGANPPTLEAMDTLPRLKYGEDYEYDPATGTLTSKTFPTL